MNKSVVWLPFKSITKRNLFSSIWIPFVLHLKPFMTSTTTVILFFFFCFFYHHCRWTVCCLIRQHILFTVWLVDRCSWILHFNFNQKLRFPNFKLEKNQLKCSPEDVAKLDFSLFLTLQSLLLPCMLFLVVITVKFFFTSEDFYLIKMR